MFCEVQESCDARDAPVMACDPITDRAQVPTLSEPGLYVFLQSAEQPPSTWAEP
jgi:hypothetical protein